MDCDAYDVDDEETAEVCAAAPVATAEEMPLAGDAVVLDAGEAEVPELLNDVVGQYGYCSLLFYVVGCMYRYYLLAAAKVDPSAPLRDSSDAASLVDS